MKTDEQKRARELRRREGLSIKEIATRVGISQSSASVWVRDIDLSDEQRRALIDRARESRNHSRISHFRARRLAYQNEGGSSAHRGDPIHAAACFVYWAEGSKSRNSVQFVNSDPIMVRFFVEFLPRQYAVPDEAFRLG